MQIMLRSGPLLVHKAISLTEVVQSKSCNRRMGPVGGNQMGKTITLGWHRLKPTVAPTTVQIEALNMSLVDDRTAIG